MLVVNIIHEGPRLFKIGRTTLVQKWTYNTLNQNPHLLPVCFLHRGQAIASGTSTGNLCVWQACSDNLYQVLPHSGERDLVSSVSPLTLFDVPKRIAVVIQAIAVSLNLCTVETKVHVAD
jgi:hypothetical protein